MTVQIKSAGAYSVAAGTFVKVAGSYQPASVYAKIAGAYQVISAAPTINADLVIYGANAGGLAAAVRARDLGLTVAVINEFPANRIGGMIMGIMHTDLFTNPLRGKGVARGVADELYRRVCAQYAQPLSQEAWLAQSFYGCRPDYVKAVIDAWMTERNFTVRSNERLISVQKTGTTITGIITNGAIYTGQTFVDATYAGDLIAMAGADTFVGRESSAQYGETNAGVRPLSTTFSTSVSPYVTSGDPTSGLLPGIFGDPYGTLGDASPLVQVCTFRLYHVSTNNQSPQPADYNPLNYELLRRNIIAQGFTQLTDVLDLYDLQDVNSYDLNNGPASGGSLNYTGPEMTEYVTATFTRRAEIEQKVKNYVLGLMYFLRTEPTLSASIRTNAALMRVMDPAVFGGDGFPPNYYLRQGRLMVGDFILKQNDVVNAQQTYATSIVGVIEYVGDRHWSRRLVVNPGVSAYVQNEGGMALTTTIGNPIPAAVLFPKAAQVTNLMSTFCVSASSVAQGSIRMEIVSMHFGQATGAIARARKDTGKTVQALTYAEYQQFLDYWNIYDTNGGALVVVPSNTGPAGVAGGTVTETGTWTVPSGAAQPCVLYGAAVGQPAATKRFAPNITTTGVYEVRLCWNAVSTTPRNTATIFRVVHAAGTFSTTKNQNTGSSASDTGDWGLVGGDLNPRTASQFTFNAGTPSVHYVECEVPATGGTGCISAVKFIKIS